VGEFAARLGTRFLVVTVVPNILLIGYISFLVAAGAPAHSPSLAQALQGLDDLTFNRIVAIILGALVISVASHPLQMPLIQLVEGYWGGLPLGPKLANRATKRFQREWSRAQADSRRTRTVPPGDWATKNIRSAAQLRLDWLPEREEDLRPTALGNTLWRGETRAGQRYGLELAVAWPRLIPSLTPDVLAELNDRRNQLDAAVRLCVTSGIATAASIGLLLWHGPWLFLALATYLLCWACYRAAIAAARGFSTSLAAAVDLYHLQLFDALSLDRPVDITQERKLNAVLTKLFRGVVLGKQGESMIHYAPPKIDNTAESGTKLSPGQQ